jgi:hypothetical protein
VAGSTKLSSQEALLETAVAEWLKAFVPARRPVVAAITKPEPVRPATARDRSPHASIAAVLRWFLQVNKRVARRLKPRLSPGDVEIDDTYDTLVASYARQAPTPVIVDVGGGKHCSFAHLVPRDGSLRIVGVDISEDELAHNDQVDEKRVADATKS